MQISTLSRENGTDLGDHGAVGFIGHNKQQLSLPFWDLRLKNSSMELTMI